jgi:hypothetical protein
MSTATASLKGIISIAAGAVLLAGHVPLCTMLHLSVPLHDPPLSPSSSAVETGAGVDVFVASFAMDGDGDGGDDDDDDDDADGVGDGPGQQDGVRGVGHGVLKLKRTLPCR